MSFTFPSLCSSSRSIRHQQKRRRRRRRRSCRTSHLEESHFTTSQYQLSRHDKPHRLCERENVTKKTNPNLRAERRQWKEQERRTTSEEAAKESKRWKWNGCEMRDGKGRKTKWNEGRRSDHKSARLLDKFITFSRGLSKALWIMFQQRICDLNILILSFVLLLILFT